MKRKVAVISGGRSAEREVSLKSGQAVFSALQAVAETAGFSDVLNLDSAMPSADFVAALQGVDVAFPILHGVGGEDGQIQGVLEYLQIPYTGSGIQASAIAMDKSMTKSIWSQGGLATPDSKTFELSKNSLDACVQDVLSWSQGQPMVVKPVDQGSSILMFRVTDEQQLRAALEENMQATPATKLVMIEQWVTGDEYTVGIVADQVLPSIRIDTPRTFYDYTAKYAANDTSYICPSGLSAQQEADLALLSLTAFKLVGCYGWGRVDVMQDQQGKFWLIEVNTLPGMTERSLVPMAAKQAGLSFSDLVLKILETATLKH